MQNLIQWWLILDLLGGRALIISVQLSVDDSQSTVSSMNKRRLRAESDIRSVTPG
ncbi:hypothetical protein [Paenibacillus amylolyticus]|uniref:hypothetical protein n=1 Tax=Paenibacillus amylolyticus TaxID=1451 RepID=UPI0039AEED7B